MKAPTTSTGQLAEVAVADYLLAHDYTIVARNWRTRWCEIDIIARKAGTVYFFEVKYRATDKQGDGLDYITPKKQRQMAFAAELWLASQKLVPESYELVAVAVSGPGYSVSPPVLVS